MLCPFFLRNSHNQRFALQVHNVEQECAEYLLCGCLPGKAPSFQHYQDKSTRVRSAGHDPGKPVDNVMIQAWNV